LNGDWLLDFAPRADFQAATNPTQGLIVSAQGFGVANRAVGGFLQTVSRNRPFGVFQQLSGYRHGWLSCLQGLASFRSRRHLRWLNRLSLHLERNPIPLSQKPRRSTTSIPQPTSAIPLRPVFQTAFPALAQAACGIWTTTATSKDDPHRGQRCPAVTRADLSLPPFHSTLAGTVCVQIGHSTCPSE
jgi:hypothetical protein